MKKIIPTLIGLIILLLFKVNIAYAQPTEKKIVTVEKGQVVDNDFYAAADTIQINGIVEGDVYAAARQVIVNGTVNGDLLAVGSQVRVNGLVSDNIRVLAGEIFIEGDIGRNVSVGTGQLTIGEDTTIVGNLTAVAGSITILPRTTILGNLNYWSQKPAEIGNDVQVMGKTFYQIAPQRNINFNVRNFLAKLAIFYKILSLFTTFLIGLLLLWLFPKYCQDSVKNITTKPWQSLLIGFLYLIITPFVLIILLITVFGIPLAILGLFGYIIFIYLARILFILWVGSQVSSLFKARLSNILVLILGLIIYFLLAYVYILGHLAAFFGVLLALGASLITKREIYLGLRKKNLV